MESTQSQDEINFEVQQHFEAIRTLSSSTRLQIVEQILCEMFRDDPKLMRPIRDCKTGNVVGCICPPSSIARVAKSDGSQRVKELEAELDSLKANGKNIKELPKVPAEKVAEWLRDGFPEEYQSK